MVRAVYVYKETLDTAITIEQEIFTYESKALDSETLYIQGKKKEALHAQREYESHAKESKVELLGNG